jgi:hypothetical protein
MSAQPLSFVNLVTMLGIEEAAQDEGFWQHACELRVAVPCVVVSFDAVKQTVVVQAAILENIMKNGVPTPTAIPPLQDVLVGGYRGGGWAVTLPLKAGDEGWVIFADMCIDAWWQSGGTANNQVERRRHDLSDGMFLPQSWSQPRKLASYSTGALEVRSDDGNTKVSLSTGQILATPDGGTTQIKATAAHVIITPDGGTSKLDITPGVTNVVGVLKVNGTVVTVP